MSAHSLSRRDFLKISVTAGAGLVIAFHLPARREAAAQDTGTVFEPNAYLIIDAEGRITVRVHRSEMGQGVGTALPMIIAEELEADWTHIRTEQAPADPVYGDQATGGSVSISSSYNILRQAGAAARTMLINAAAQTWGVEPESCRAENSTVIHEASGRRLSYGELVAVAATLPVPRGRDVVLKDPADFRLIGTPQGPINAHEIVTGRAVYGLDVRLPDMLYAAVARCPVFGGRVDSFDPGAAAAVEGVREVVEISTGVAVVAESTWAALQGRAALTVSWNRGDFAGTSSADIHTVLAERLAEVVPAGPSDGTDRVLEATYELPYLAHATMEPQNCTADVRADICELWVPTQDRQAAQATARSIARVPVNVHTTLLGCGSGRRLAVDYVPEAVELSRAVGAPVQVVWTREDDIRHDVYRPASLHFLRARLNEDGLPISWEHYIAAQPHGDITAGAADMPYRLIKQTRGTPVNLPVPVGYWRAVFNTQNGFVVESFMDEIAAQGGLDPLELRLSLLLENAPQRRVLMLAAERAGWGSPLPDGMARGIACHTTWGETPVAQVVEVSVNDFGWAQVSRVVCVVDCGLVINPDMVEAQMEGGIIFGLTAALRGAITLVDGRVEQGNFDDYPLLRFNEVPPVEVHIVPGEGAPHGVGEMSGPVIAPAVTNALYALTGRRIRRLPIQAADLRA